MGKKKKESLLEFLDKKIEMKAEVIGFISALLVFLSIFIGSLSAVTYEYVFLFWLIFEALIAYIAGIIAGYAYFSIYKVKFGKKKK